MRLEREEIDAIAEAVVAKLDEVVESCQVLPNVFSIPQWPTPAIGIPQLKRLISSGIHIETGATICRANHVRMSRSRTPEYNVWNSMIQRCNNPKNPGYKNYGARGITVDPEWQSRFEAFLAYVGARPTGRHTIERIDNDKGYQPGNVRWATQAEQLRNTRRTNLITFNGRTMPLTDWAAEVGMNETGLRNRIQRGWTLNDAMTLPLYTRRRRT